MGDCEKDNIMTPKLLDNRDSSNFDLDLDLDSTHDQIP